MRKYGIENMDPTRCRNDSNEPFVKWVCNAMADALYYADGPILQKCRMGTPYLTLPRLTTVLEEANL